MIRLIKQKYAPNITQGVISLAMISLFFWLGYTFLSWAILNSAFLGDANTCRDISGACWPFIREKSTFILFGVYPRQELWRPILGLILVILFWFHFTRKNNWNRYLLLKFPLLFLFYFYFL